MRGEPTSAVASLRHLRWALLATTVASCLGAFAELASLEHWVGTQLIAWVVTAIVLLGGLAWALVRGNVGRWVARGAGLVGIFGAAIGVWEHIESNMETAPLSQRWSATWESLPALQKFWLAATGQAGPNPALAPGMLGLAGLLLLLVTWGRDEDS